MRVLSNSSPWGVGGRVKCDLWNRHGRDGSRFSAFLKSRATGDPRSYLEGRHAAVSCRHTKFDSCIYLTSPYPRPMRYTTAGLSGGSSGANVTGNTRGRARPPAPRAARHTWPTVPAPRPANRPRRASRESVWSIWNAQDGAFNLDAPADEPNHTIIAGPGRPATCGVSRHRACAHSFNLHRVYVDCAIRLHCLAPIPCGYYHPYTEATLHVYALSIGPDARGGARISN